MARLTTLIGLAVACSSAPDHRRPAPDLTGHKAVTIYFLLGSLDESGARQIVEGHDGVEEFRCDEEEKARSFRTFLGILAEEQNLNPLVVKEPLQWCLTRYHSMPIATLLNSFYEHEFKDSRNSTIDGKVEIRGRWLRFARAQVKPGMFNAASRAAKLAYLSGAYWRFGGQPVSGSARSSCASSPCFALPGAPHKAEVIAGLLRELGCTDVRTEFSRRPTPEAVTSTVTFQPSDEVSKWLSQGHPSRPRTGEDAARENQSPAPALR